MMRLVRSDDGLFGEHKVARAWIIDELGEEAYV
jgi:hypothetical protein